MGIINNDWESSVEDSTETDMAGMACLQTVFLSADDDDYFQGSSEVVMLSSIRPQLLLSCLLG